jgi:hypothetical protein
MRAVDGQRTPEQRLVGVGSLEHGELSRARIYVLIESEGEQSVAGRKLVVALNDSGCVDHLAALSIEGGGENGLPPPSDLFIR